MTAGVEQRPLGQRRVWASHEWRLLVGGELTAGRSGERMETVSPSTEEVLGSVPVAGPDDVALAVERGLAAQRAWARTPVAERAAVVRRIAAVLREHADELAMLDAFDGGNPVTAMRGDVGIAAAMVEMFADLAPRLIGEVLPGAASTVRQPYGVVARIVPYNHPLMFTASRLAAPLVAGNAVVVKAPDQAPLAPLRLGELLAGVVPDGLVSILSGDGARTGAAVVAHPRIRRIAFIGSVPTGRSIQRAAADAGVKHVTLELGGKNPLIICADADPAEAAAGAVRGMNFRWTAGQSCGSTSRLLVHESRYEEVLERVAAEAATIRVGDPLDPATEMGPLVSAAHLDRVTGYVEGAVRDGARLVTGGRAPAGSTFERGFWLAPTVLADVRPGSRLEQEEVFGPVLAVLPFRDDDEALRIANGTAYGLTASVWTRDVDRAARYTEELEAGYVWVNTSSAHHPGAPFGGWKDSGVGKEESLDELLSFTQVKTVHTATPGGSR